MIPALLQPPVTPRPSSHATALADVADDELLPVAHAAHVVRHPRGVHLVTSRHHRRPGHAVPGYLRLSRPACTTRRVVLALRYRGLIGGLVACAVILGAPPLLTTVAALVGALLGTAAAR